MISGRVPFGIRPLHGTPIDRRGRVWHGVTHPLTRRADEMSGEERLALAVRKNQGRRRSAACRDRAASLLGRAAETIQLTELEERVRVWRRFGALRARAGERCGEPGHYCAEASGRDEFSGHMARLASRFPPLEMLVHLEESDVCGAVIAGSTELLDRWESFVAPDGEDLLCCTHDGSAGIFAACWTEGYELVYELRAWWDQAGNPASGS